MPTACGLGINPAASTGRIYELAIDRTLEKTMDWTYVDFIRGISFGI